MLLWLWPAATAPIRPLAWKSPYASRVALKRKTKNKKTPTNLNQLVFKCQVHPYILPHRWSAARNTLTPKAPKRPSIAMELVIQDSKS